MSKQNNYLSDRELQEAQLEELKEIRKAFTKTFGVQQAPIEVLDNADLKRMFNLSDSTLRRRRKEGALPFHRAGRGRKIFYLVTDVEKLLGLRIDRMRKAS
jgi:hypothetical protein